MPENLAPEPSSEAAARPPGGAAAPSHAPADARTGSRWRSALIAVVCLLVTYAFGTWLRAEDWSHWQQERESFYYNGEPMLVNADGYYYLRLARDLDEGTYAPTDPLRLYGENPPRPSPPPLLVSATKSAKDLSDRPLIWVAVFLPVFLGPLLGWIVYLLARLNGGGVAMGLTAALASVASTEYVKRTSLGWYDTDCLVVTFSVAAVYFFQKFALATRGWRYVHFALGVLTFAAFLLSWDTAPEVVAAICLPPMIAALALYYRPAKREALLFGASLGVGLLGFLAWRGWGAPFEMVGKAFATLGRLSGSGSESLFPPTTRSIDELSVPSLGEIATFTTGSGIVFALALVGFVLFCARRGKALVFFLVPGALAALSFFFGNRFVIFFAPVTALGIGYLVQLAGALLGRSKPLVAIASAALAAAALWPAVGVTRKEIYRPLLTPFMYAIERAGQETPPNAVIWTPWYLGYPVLYYARRAVLGDGQSPEGERFHFLNLPLAASNARFSANFMQFYARYGMAGMERVFEAVSDPPTGMDFVKQIFGAGPEQARPALESGLSTGRLQALAGLSSADDWLRYLFPADAPPVHLLLHGQIMQTPWYWYGSWDLRTRQGVDSAVQPFEAVRLENGQIVGLGASGELRFDAQRGATFDIMDNGQVRPMPLAYLTTQRAGKLETVEYGKPDGLVFEWIEIAGFGALMKQVAAESLLNRLLIRLVPNRQYFRHQIVETPYCQLWEVLGEKPRR